MWSQSTSTVISEKPRVSWVKFRKVRQMHCLARHKKKNVLVISGGCYVLFFEVEGPREWVFRAVSEEKGEGVQCLDVSLKSPVFAFAEKCMNPRIFVYSFPAFKCLNMLKDGSINGYISIAFSEKEYLVSLGTFPKFQVIVWNWMTGMKLAVHDSPIHDEKQLLKCSISGPFAVGQVCLGVSTVVLWSVQMCGTVCRLLKEELSLPLERGSHICDACWAPDNGPLFLLDKSGDVYTVEAESGKCTASLVLRWEGHKGAAKPCMLWTKAGLLIAGPDGLVKLFALVSKRRPSIGRGPAPQEPAWRVSWVATPKYFFTCFCTSETPGGRSGVYGCTHRGEVYKIQENQMVQFRNYGTGVLDFDYVYPYADTVCTINEYGNMLFWDREKGYMMGGHRVGRGCVCVVSSPTFPVLAVGRSDGALMLVSGERPSRPHTVAELTLCADAIDAVLFTFSGNHLLAQSRPTGQLFMLKAPPCEKVFVMAYANVEKPIADVAVSEMLHLQLIRVVVLLQNLSCCGQGGPEFYIYTVHVHEAAELIKLMKLKLMMESDFSYVSLASSPFNNLLYIAAPHRSRQLHVFLMESEFSNQPFLVSATASGHQVRGFSVAVCGGEHPELIEEEEEIRKIISRHKTYAARRAASIARMEKISSRSSKNTRVGRGARGSRDSEVSQRGRSLDSRPASMFDSTTPGAGALLLSAGRDGVVVIHSVTNMKAMAAVVVHHRVDGGVLSARTDPFGRSLVTLGRDGVLVCTSIMPAEDVELEEEELGGPARGTSIATMLSARSRRSAAAAAQQSSAGGQPPTTATTTATRTGSAIGKKSLTDGEDDEIEDDEDEDEVPLKDRKSRVKSGEKRGSKEDKEKGGSRGSGSEKEAQRKSEEVRFKEIDSRGADVHSEEGLPRDPDASTISLFRVLDSEYKLIGIEKGTNWLQFQQDVKAQEEVLSFGTMKKNIMTQLRELRAVVVKLLDANEAGPEEEHLPVSVFDMDVEGRERKIQVFKLELQETITRIKAEMAVKEKLTAKIRGRTWDKMAVQSSRLHAFLRGFFVENYVLFLPYAPEQERLEKLEKRMRITSEITRLDTFFPWMINQDYEAVREGSVLQGTRRASNALADLESVTSVDSEDHSYVFSGSSSYQYATLSPFHCTQFELCTYQHLHQEVMLLQKIVTDLQSYFNSEFEKVRLLKETEMSLLAEKNKRRRHLLSELCIDGIDVIDTEWNAYEEPDRLMTVAESEVTAKPYLTPSEEALRDRLAAEREAERLRLLADDFRERALIAMMHGVLELRWEDKIKRDVPRPKCMIDKPPEEWNEEDLRAIRDYDEKVLLLMEQRRLYRKMCAKEYETIQEQQRESMLKFDEKLHELLQLKMKIQVCIDEENLKILRWRMKIHERMQLEESEKKILKELAQVEEEASQVAQELQDLQEAKREVKQILEAALIKDKTMERSFRREFRDMHHATKDALNKLYKRRVKTQHRSAVVGALTDVLQQLVSAPSGIPIPAYVPYDMAEYLHALEGLDAYVNAPQSVLESDWINFCRVRRQKIESELRVKSLTMQVSECDGTINVFNKKFAVLKDRIIMLNNSLKDIREEQLEAAHNITVQLVMKQGFVEIPDDYEIGDFQDCVLINRSVVQKINAQILEAGEKKLKAMQQLTNFHRVVMCKEWEHKKRRMEIEDLQTKLKYIDGVKLTREMQLLLRLRKVGVPMESVKENLDKQIAAYKSIYEKIVTMEKEKLSEVSRHIRRMKREGHDLDKSIKSVNVDVNEMILERDFDFEEEQLKLRKYRMKLIVRRAQAMRTIQKQHHEMLLLQTELELLRLRTFPTLKYALCDYLCF